MNEPRSPLMSVADVARFLSMSVSWVYKEVEAGRLPCVRLGASVRFVPNEIQRHVQGLRSRTGEVVRLRSKDRLGE